MHLTRIVKLSMIAAPEPFDLLTVDYLLIIRVKRTAPTTLAVG